MDIAKIVQNEDGWNLIIEEEYSLSKIRTFIKNSCLAENEILNNALADMEVPTDENVEKLCAAFLDCLNGETNLDELTSLFVVACMIYNLKEASVESSEIRTIERIWKNLKTENNTSYVFLISLCRELAVINATGRAVAICLAWTILHDILNIDLQMFCFQEFSAINTILKDIDLSKEDLQNDDDTKAIYIVIQVVGVLINMVVLSSNKEFIKSYYRPYFKYKLKDLKKLKEWAEQLSNLLSASNAKACKYWDLHMSMTEYLKMNIVSPLYDKIRDIQ